jgi:1-acyl-sn-glycerol-3-phosphate acyltransferase
VPDPARSPPVPLRDLMAELYTYVAFGASMTITLPFVLASRVRHTGELPRAPGRWVRRLGRVTSRLTPLWSFSIEGAAPPDIASRAYVVVANHLSHVDPFLLSSLPWDMRWVAKEELFKTPLAGWILTLGGDVPLRRGSGESVRAMLDGCREALDGGLSVMLFPEGTRSRDGALQPFKDGAFELAVERGAPVLPVAIAGTERCMQKGSSRLGRARAIARILEPMETRGMTQADIATLRESTRGQILRGVEGLRVKLAEEE